MPQRSIETQGFGKQKWTEVMLIKSHQKFPLPQGKVPGLCEFFFHQEHQTAFFPQRSVRQSVWLKR